MRNLSALRHNCDPRVGIFEALIKRSGGLGKGISILLCALALGGCHTVAHGNRQTINIDTTPSGASGAVIGQQFTTPATIRTHRRHSTAVVRVSKPGYQPRCQVVEAANRDGSRFLTVLDSIPVPIGLAIDAMVGSLGGTFPTPINMTLEPIRDAGARVEEIPFSDDEIVSAWENQHRDLCATEEYNDTYTSPEQVARSRQADYARIIVTTGPISQQYQILGNIHADTAGLVNVGAVLNDVLFRSRLAASIQATPHANNEQMNQLLRERGLATYGSRLGAVINVTYRVEPNGHVAADGLAVAFPEPLTEPGSRDKPTATTGSSVEERLERLKALYDQGLISKDEYKTRRGRALEAF